VNFVHIPKTAGTSIYKTLGIKEPGHKRLLEYTPNTFSVVRNPFDRLVSHFCYIKTNNSYYYKKHPQCDLMKDCNFSDFVYLLLSSKETLLDPQCYYICDDKDNVLVEHILRFESLNEDFKKFWDLNLLHVNKSKRKKDWRFYYNDKTLEIVNKVYAKDFQIFNYKMMLN